MIVTDGVALTGTRDGTILEFTEGETVWCPPDVDHCHGATPDAPMTHLVITGTKDGQNVIWKEQVTDEQYFSKSTDTSAEETMNIDEALSKRQQAIISIAAFTASGELDKLNSALNDGLDAGLTIIEIKEILVQLYSYAGFPRSLNGIHAFMAVLDKRQARGIEDEVGREASPIPSDMNRDEYGAQVRSRLAGIEVIPPPSGYQLFTPVIDTFLKEHLFADIFARDVLNHQERELVTITALANISGTAGQLYFHLGAALNSGLTETELRGFIAVLEAEVGKHEAENAREVLGKVLSSRT